MSLSRPIKFPLLKLPWLCIEGVVRSWDVFDIIFFALTSKKTRRIVKSLTIPLNGIHISVSATTHIWLCSRVSKTWYLQKTSFESLLPQNARKTSFTLRDNPKPLYISSKDDIMNSYCNGNELIALKMAMEFLNEMFKCSVEKVDIDRRFFSDFSCGVKSTKNLFIRYNNSWPFSRAQNLQVNMLLENLEVTDTCTFDVTNTENVFYCHPKLFKCKELKFYPGSAPWVTREILLQFEVPRLTFHVCPFSVEDILSFVTQWFHSDDKKFERLYIAFECEKFSLKTFQTAELNPEPFSGRNRVPLSECFIDMDFSKGLEIVRHDGLQATIHFTGRDFLFYIWHN
ncbi:unnamed protein product [Caenorhabditis brenneri]